MLNTLIKAPRTSLIYGDSTSTTYVTYVVPNLWKAGRIIIQAITANVFIQFGTVIGIECDATAKSTVGTGVLTVNAKTGMCIPANTAIEFQLESDMTHFSIDSDGVGEWRGWRSDV